LKRTATTLIKLALSLALLVAIVAYSGPREVLGALRGMAPALVGLGFVLLLADALVRSFNWFQLARNAGCPLPLGTVAHAYFAGGFIGALLPSTLGTDMARSAVAARRTRAPLELLLATTVLLNVLSLAAISVTGLGASLSLLGSPNAPRGALAASAGTASVCLLVIATLWASVGSQRPYAARTAAPGSGLSGRIRQRLAGFRAALAFRPRPRALAGIGGVALLNYALRTLGWLTLLAAAGADVAWAVLLAIGPLLTIGATLPISVLGFGGFQAISVALLSVWGVPAQQALAASLVQSGLSLVLYGIGCVAYLAGGREPLTPPRTAPQSGEA
jgi:uncharacterized protein (TIRG00374 family)